MIERPLDLLNESKGKNVLLTLKNGKVLRGTLLAFDIHINIVLDNTEEVDGKSLGLTFVRGDAIIHISK